MMAENKYPEEYITCTWIRITVLMLNSFISYHFISQWARPSKI